MFFIFGETTRQHPGHFPWVPTFLILGFLLIAGGITWGVATDWPGTTQSQSAPLAQEVQVDPAPDFSTTVENAPAQTEAEVVAPATPREVEVPWVLLGTGKPITETMDRLGIPWEKWVHMPGAKAKEQLNFFTEYAGGFGDGTAYLLEETPNTTNPRVDNPAFYFTPNQGKTWFRVANPYPGESSTTPFVGGASIEGDNLVLFLDLQPEPWVAAWWRAEIPLAELERPAS